MAAGTPAAAAASKATSTIPVVMATGVGLGTQLTDGASKPNANVTGFSDLPPGVSEKRLTLLQAMTGKGAPLAILCDRGNPSSPLALAETRKAAQPLGITVKDYWIASADEFGQALAAMKADGIRGFVVAPGGLFFAQRAALAGLAIENGLATITARREYAEAGCLMTYGAPIRENYRQAAIYVSRILGGVKPADLPVDEPTEFDFVINTATAEALGLTPPPELLAKAKAWCKANPKPSQPWDTKGFRIPGGDSKSPGVVQVLAIAPSMANAKAHGNYPALTHIMSCLFEGGLLDFDAASQVESRYFAACVVSQTSKNMIGTLWHQLNAIKKGQSRPKGVAESKVKKLGILGAGMMGEIGRAHV